MGFYLEYLQPFSDAEARGKVHFGVQITSEASEMPNFECRVLGTFVLLEPDAYNQIPSFDQMFLHTVFSILYGIIRALAIQVSATAPKGKLMLPLVDPTSIVQDYLSKNTSFTD
ncbi:MAG: hypothetical protein JNN12_02910 [Bacteroidetes Order II. Incertae sedis bacterium]|nr:hypothetical protein [Bacteroidetes Order II. bacterium]